MRRQEIQKLRIYLQQHKDNLSTEQFTQIQQRISKLNHLVQKNKQEDLKKQIVDDHYKQEYEKVKSTGKKPYYLKDCTLLLYIM